MNISQYFLIGVAGLMSMSATAQWQWIDQGGHRVFSDRAPPLDVPEKNILKSPSVQGAKKALPTESAASPAITSTQQDNTLNISGIDKELIEKKKLADQAAAAKRQVEQEKILKIKIENCSRAKQAKANFDSGMRIARTNEKGEREVIDDTLRAAEVKRIQTIINADCN
jgi:hypothetical protein